jgi:hypothetical protein
VITNALFLTLSARLFNTTRDPQYLNQGMAQYQWFEYWLANGAKFDVPGPFPGWLIRQLPLGQLENFWTGDQGALLGGLASLRDCFTTSNPGFAKQLGNMCAAIAQAVTTSKQMVWPVSWRQNARVLHEAEPSPGDWRFDLNGSVGKGVVMRYLGAYWGKRYGFIENNAAAVVHAPLKDGYFADSWVEDPNEQINSDLTNLSYLTRQCSGQDAMNAWLLPPATGDDRDPISE